MKIYRSGWFFQKQYIFKLDEIYRVYIRNRGQARSGSVIIGFYDIDDECIGAMVSKMHTFELRRLKKKLEELGIKVEVDEIRGRKI